MTREIVLDTETTGLTSSDRIIEIGCVELNDKILTGKTYQQYINPKCDINPYAQKVHGLSSSFLADKPTFAEIADEFLDFIGDANLVIHNASFDMRFLNSEMQLCNRQRLGNSTTDTVAMARRKYPHMENHKLDTLCSEFSIHADRDLHGGLIDAQLLAQVYIRMG